MHRHDWLAQVAEEIIDPDLPICDPHHHLWDRPGDRYLLDDLLRDTGSGHRVVSTVFIECGAMYRARGPEALRPLGETEFVNGQAAMSASGGYGPTRAAAAIVGHANLMLGEDVGPVLDMHMRLSERFRGIRHTVAWDPDPELRRARTNPTAQTASDPQFRRGFAELGRRGLTFEAWCYHHQIPQIADLARAFPDTTIILNHFGGPLGVRDYEGKRAEIFAAWKPAIAELARCENVVAKLGGLVMPINGFGFEHRPTPPTSEELAAATRDWYLHTIDRFGPNRCMFESNFPVDRASCSYAVLWNSFKRLTADFSPADKAALFHDTAARVYSITPDGV